jgi:hypothetical protein
MYWTPQNLKDSANKQKILHYSSILSGATVYVVGDMVFWPNIAEANQIPGFVKAGNVWVPSEGSSRHQC